MQTGTVQEIGLSKSGKPKVKVDNQWYSIKGTLGMVPGQKIEFEAHEFQFNGKQFWGIDRFALLPTSNGVHAAPAAPPQDHWKPNTTIPVNAAPSGPEPQKASPVSYSDGERLFMSNIVAAAIGAGKIQDPVDLIAWTQAALQALRNCVEQSF